MKRLVIATKNIGKFREISSFLNGIYERFFSLNDFKENIEVVEDRDHYSENAIKKARKIGDRFEIDTLSDDSGLEVEALEGRPGIFSSRYGSNDEERVARLLGELEGVPWEKRKAVFKAFLALYLPEKERGYIFYGCLSGYIGFEKHGVGGFGYDPVFFVPELNRYLAEISTEEKNTISHRGRALQSMKRFLVSGQLY